MTSPFSVGVGGLQDQTRGLPKEAITAAMELVGAVHDYGSEEVAAVLSPLDRQDLYNLAVTLAALVPMDKPLSELLAWNDDHPALPFPRPSEVTDRSQRAFQLLRGAS